MSPGRRRFATLMRAVEEPPAGVDGRAKVGDVSTTVLQDVTDFCRLFLFRHPELADEFNGVAVGSGDARLSRRGERAVLGWLRALEGVELQSVWSSSQPQCVDAAMAIAAAKGLEPTLDERLRDQDLGDWQGRAWEDVAREDPDAVRSFFADFGEIVAPGGESLGVAIERLIAWWDELRAEMVGNTVAVVASGALVSGFAAAMLGMRLSRAVSLNLPHGGVGVVDVFGNGVRLSVWNGLGLAGDGR